MINGANGLEEDYMLRFANVGRLYERTTTTVGSSLNRLLRAHVCVIGLGGVGSWVVESLARSGVGRYHLNRISLLSVWFTNIYCVNALG